MCGIAGFCSSPVHAPSDLALMAARMGTAIAHRGPDAAVTWQRSALGVALVHHFLGILYLTPAGPQPMASASSRNVIAFNGKISNHQQLRSELDAAGLAPAWHGHADTDTLQAVIEAWGLQSAPPALRRHVGPTPDPLPTRAACVDRASQCRLRHVHRPVAPRPSAHLGQRAAPSRSPCPRRPAPRADHPPLAATPQRPLRPRHQTLDCADVAGLVGTVGLIP